MRQLLQNRALKNCLQNTYCQLNLHFTRFVRLTVIIDQEGIRNTVNPKINRLFSFYCKFLTMKMMMIVVCQFNEVLEDKEWTYKRLEGTQQTIICS